MHEPSRRRLSLAHLSLIASEPADFVQIAARAGFDLVDLRLSPATAADRVYTPAQRESLSGALLAILRDTGLRVWDVEIVRIGDHARPEDHLPLMEAAALLGAERLKVVCDTGNEALALGILVRLCELAAPLGLTIDLEYMVFSGVKSLRAALNMVAAAAQPNLRVLVDALHWMRAGDTLADVRSAPQKYLGYVQLCDGPRDAPVGRELLIQEARTNRLAPGEGRFPLAALLRAMPADCVVSLEVPLPPGRDADAHALRLFSAAKALFEKYEHGAAR